MKLNLGFGDDPLEGFVNLDKRHGWRFESGLALPGKSVAAITVSHALMYVTPEDLPYVIKEFYRVLLDDPGVLRITEDDCDNPASPRFGGHPEARSLTSPARTRAALEAAGFLVKDCTAAESFFEDNSLCQHLHGDPPKVFFIEGIK